MGSAFTEGQRFVEQSARAFASCELAARFELLPWGEQ
jgi:hypothetical protein